MRFSEKLENHLLPYRNEYRTIVNGWLQDGSFAVTYPALLVETYHYVKHSCSLILKAAEQLSDEYAALRDYLIHHSEEEFKHEEWVLADLQQLGYEREAVESSQPLPETINLIGSQLYIINYLHPAGLLGYVYLMESTPPSPESLDYLHNVMGIPLQAMTFLVKHGELDIKHRRELIEMLDTHFITQFEQEAAITSGVIGLSNVNRFLARLRSGDFLSSRPQLLSTDYSYIRQFYFE